MPLVDDVQPFSLEVLSIVETACTQWLIPVCDVIVV